MQASLDEDDAFPSSRSSTTNSIDLSYLQMANYPMDEQLLGLLRRNSSTHVHTDTTMALYMQHNQLTYLPSLICSFNQLRMLDVSSNHLTEIGEEILQLTQLTSLVAKNNLLNDHSLPKDLGLLKGLEELNLSGNAFTTVVPQILELENLRGLFFGANQLIRIPSEINRLQKLNVLYLGGNHLQEIPAEMGHLLSLQALILCENQLQSLPSTISHLDKLRSLALHKNHLTTLPPEIIQLQSLVELSLRENPLVVRFIRDMVYNPPSLLELAARTVQIKNVSYNLADLPKNLVEYLKTARRCVNPKCKGVYFDAPVEHVKFVDFCGKYRIPLMEYLCSPRCTTHPAIYSSDSDISEDESSVPVSRLKKVLLG